jgi:DNA invertase Pin-like site-specific DNA recombinase
MKVQFNMKKGAVVYLNTKKRGDFEEQLAAVENYAKYRFTINNVFHDHRTQSAPPEQRVSYKEMMRFSQQNAIENVIFYNLPELCKSLDQSLDTLKNLTLNGYDVYFADQKFMRHLDNATERRDAILDFISFMELYQNTGRRSPPARSRKGKKEGRPIGRPKALDTGQMEALVTVRRAGTSIGQICKMFNVSRSTVSKILADHPELKGEWKGNKSHA